MSGFKFLCSFMKQIWQITFSSLSLPSVLSSSSLCPHLFIPHVLNFSSLCPHLLLPLSSLSPHLCSCSPPLSSLSPPYFLTSAGSLLPLPPPSPHLCRFSPSPVPFFSSPLQMLSSLCPHLLIPLSSLSPHLCRCSPPSVPTFLTSSSLCPHLHYLTVSPLTHIQLRLNINLLLSAARWLDDMPGSGGRTREPARPVFPGDSPTCPRTHRVPALPWTYIRRFRGARPVRNLCRACPPVECAPPLSHPPPLVLVFALIAELRYNRR